MLWKVLILISLFLSPGEICHEVFQTQFGAARHRSVLQADEKDEIHRQFPSQQQSQPQQEPKDPKPEVWLQPCLLIDGLCSFRVCVKTNRTSSFTCVERDDAGSADKTAAPPLLPRHRLHHRHPSALPRRPPASRLVHARPHPASLTPSVTSKCLFWTLSCPLSPLPHLHEKSRSGNRSEE